MPRRDAESAHPVQIETALRAVQDEVLQMGSGRSLHALPQHLDEHPRSSSRDILDSAATLEDMTILRIDNVGIVVDDLRAAIAFFVELGLELEGETTVEGQSVDRIVGLDGVQSDIAMMRAPDGNCRLELTKFRAPPATTVEPNAPVNTLGIRRIMFTVEDIEDVLARLQAKGAELLGEVVQYEDSYRLCYVRGPEGIIVALAEQLS